MEEYKDITPTPLDEEKDDQQLIDLDKPMQPGKVSGWIPKTELENKSVKLTIKFPVLVKDKFDRLNLCVEYNNDIKRLPITEGNRNQLMAFFGPTAREWQEKSVIVEGKPFEKEGLSSGVQITFKKA